MEEKKDFFPSYVHGPIGPEVSSHPTRMHNGLKVGDRFRWLSSMRMNVSVKVALFSKSYVYPGVEFYAVGHTS
jgi:hypothetical protein